MRRRLAVLPLVLGSAALAPAQDALLADLTYVRSMRSARFVEVGLAIPGNEPPQSFRERHPRLVRENGFRPAGVGGGSRDVPGLLRLPDDHSVSGWAGW